MTESDGPMPAPPQPHASEPLRASLSDADDRLRLNHWMALQQGVAPRIRIGRRWINSLWGLPIGAAALLCLIALAQSLRELPGVAAFIQQHPGIAQSAPSVDVRAICKYNSRWMKSIAETPSHAADHGRKTVEPQP